MEIPTLLEKGQYQGQVMFGHDTLRQNGAEVVAQKWNALTEDGRMFSVLNKGSHGSSEKDGTIGLTLLHSAGYSAADGDFERTLREKRHTVRMEQGERLFSFKVEAGKTEELEAVLDQKAQVYNEEPYAFVFSASGTGKKAGSFMTIDNPAVLVSACKRAESGEGYTIRVFETANKESEGMLYIPALGITKKISLKPFELKTLHLDETAGVIADADIFD